MKCPRCNVNEATVPIAVVGQDGKVRETIVCSECAEALGVGGMFSSFPGFGSLDYLTGALEMLFGNFFGFPSGHKSAPHSTRSAAKCPHCGSTFDDIAKRGLVGCAQCYSFFAEQLAPTIEHLHGSRTYNGENAEPRQTAAAPAAQQVAAPSPAASNAAKLAELKARLAQAVREERYEDAAVLRDEIKKLEA